MKLKSILNWSVATVLWTNFLATNNEKLTLMKLKRMSKWGKNAEKFQ